jgi:hypothetical protein
MRRQTIAMAWAPLWVLLVLWRALMTETSERRRLARLARRTATVSRPASPPFTTVALIPALVSWPTWSRVTRSSCSISVLVLCSCIHPTGGNINGAGANAKVDVATLKRCSSSLALLRWCTERCSPKSYSGGAGNCTPTGVHMAGILEVINDACDEMGIPRAVS